MADFDLVACRNELASAFGEDAAQHAVLAYLEAITPGGARGDEPIEIKDPTGWCITVAQRFVGKERKFTGRQVAIEPNSPKWTDGGEGDPDREPLAQGDSELERALHRALGLLPERDRALIIAKDLDEQDYEVVASQFGLPVATAKSAVQASRRRLSQQLFKVLSEKQTLNYNDCLRKWPWLRPRRLTRV